MRFCSRRDAEPGSTLLRWLQPAAVVVVCMLLLRCNFFGVRRARMTDGNASSCGEAWLLTVAAHFCGESTTIDELSNRSRPLTMLKLDAFRSGVFGSLSSLTVAEAVQSKLSSSSMAIATADCRWRTGWMRCSS